MSGSNKVLLLLKRAKALAREYYHLTGKPLGVTGEVAEHEAATHLKLELTPARSAGYDAIEKKRGVERRLQIKGRCILNGSSRSQRLGRIDVKKKCDAVLMVLLDQHFNATQIYEASWWRVVNELKLPGSKARNERGSLGIAKFKKIATLRWSRDWP